METLRVLHIRRLADFEPEVDDWLDEQVSAAQELFSSAAGIDLSVGSDTTSLFAEGVVNVDQCLMVGGNTAEQLALFNNMSDVPATATDIVVFVVRDFTPWKGGGCAWHPPGRLGCMVTAGTPGFAQWKLAHEVGHVLGLFHNDSEMMVMFASVFWEALPPYLSSEEIAFLQGVGVAPKPKRNPSLALSEENLNFELRKIEPDYRSMAKHGTEAVPLLRRIYEKTRDPEYRARAIYALSLVSRDIDDILTGAANSRESQERRAAADAAGRLVLEPIGKRILFQLIRDPDPSVRYVAAKHVPISTRGAIITTRPARRATLKPASTETLCQQGGPEIPATVVTCLQGDVAAFNYYVCKSTARVRVHLALHEVQRQLLADEKGKNKINLILPKLPPGRHLLYWGFQQAGFQWQTRAELLINGACVVFGIARRTTATTLSTEASSSSRSLLIGRRIAPANVGEDEMKIGADAALICSSAAYLTEDAADHDAR
jgi:hypothetical protein